MNTALLVGAQGKTFTASLLQEACKKYPGCYGTSVIIDEDIISERENFDPEMDTASRATMIYNKLADYKDSVKVLWLSKDPVSGQSMQPFDLLEEEEKLESGETVTATRVVAFLYGDYTPSKHENSTETGEYHAFEDTLKPTITEMLGECQGDVDNLETRLDAENAMVLENLCDNPDCGAFILFFDSKGLEIAHKDHASKVVDGYNTTDHTLFVDPASSRGVEVGSINKKKRTLGKGSTIREPVSVKGANELAAQSGGKVSVLQKNEVIKVKAGVPAWACGNNSNQKNWYRACNLLKDKQGNGVIPPGNPNSWPKKPEVEVDARVLKATSFNELALIIKSISLPAATPDNVVKPATDTAVPHPVSPANQRFVKTTSAAEKEAWMKSAIREKLVNPVPAAAADIQAEEKDLMTFQAASGIPLVNLKGKLFEDLFNMVTQHPKTATQALWDLLNRNPITGAVSTPAQTTGPSNVVQQQKKRRIGASR